MDTQKPKSIKNVGLTIAILSGLVVFSNGMSALMFTLLGFNNYENNEDQDLTYIDSFFNNIQYFLLLLVAIGILFLIGGIQLMKYKMWAKKLLLTLSIVLIGVLSIVLILAIYSAYVDNDALFALIPISFVWLAFTLPLWFLILFLNNESVQKHLKF